MEFIYKWALCNSRPLSDVQTIGSGIQKGFKQDSNKNRVDNE